MIDLSCYYGFCDHGNCPLFFINNLMKKIARPDEGEEQKNENSPIFKALDPGYLYELSNGQKIQFLKKEGDKGVTHEELILILMDRINTLDEKLPCEENMIVVSKLQSALKYLNLRTLIRVDQGVKGSDKAHDPIKAQQYLFSLKSNTL